MNQWNKLYEEEAKDEEEVEEEDEEDQTEVEEKVQQVPPKTPSKRVQKNHPSDQIIGNKDAGVETRRRIHFTRTNAPSTLIYD
jgi:hypothetical protein